ncbi:MAG: MraY family glycosyltransferase [Bacilli bacterium]|nr:MraY family glycosyltransferase [Bacilli bacterium]MDD4808658.1 MraY family glycosyltransferase [Bacilli bacterium]
MTQDEIIKIVSMVLSTFILVAALIPFIRKIAIHISAVDLPNERKIHKVPMPRLGGLGIFFGFLFGYMIYGTPSAIMNSILIGSFIIVLTGVVDDIKPLKASTKFFGQLISALIIVFYGNILLKDVSAFGIYLEFGFLSYPLTIFFILGCINCMNLIDGLDGLAAGISAIYFLTIGVIAMFNGNAGLDLVLTFVMLGSTLGFLLHNFPPASIFMGDSGSMFLGFIIAVIALLGFKNITMTSLIIPLLILAIPILDTMFAIIRRLLKGESISSPDKFHIHHQLLKRNFTQKQTVLIIYFINLLFATASIVFFLKDRVLGYIIYSILIIIVIFFVAKTNVVYEFNGKKPKFFEKFMFKKK